jgi:membrane protease YdiL (CAAX protease family)
MKRYFVGDHGRLRALWRISIFIILFVSITIPLMLGVRELNGGMPGGSALQISIVAIAATIAVLLARKLLDKRTFGSLGVQTPGRVLPDLLFGTLISVGVISAFFAVAVTLGYIRYDGISWWSNDELPTYDLRMAATVVALALIKFAFVAWWEELVFRGYLLQNLIDGLGRTWAITLSCVIFGLVHAFNPNATILSVAIIMLITLQLLYAYFVTAHLWLPMGMHLAWNFTQGSVFGFAASGYEAPSLVEQTPIAPNWLSGGAFGPEESVVIVPLLLLSFPAFYFYGRVAGHGNNRR